MLHRRAIAFSVLLALGCSGPVEVPESDGGPPPGPPTLETDAVVSFATVYESGVPFAGREWIPMDLSSSPNGELWVVQRISRHPDFTDATECLQSDRFTWGADCDGLGGGTVAITDPTAAGAATGARARLVVDANAWHFMRRPSAIAFGAPELVIEPDDPGALHPMTGEPLLTEPMTLTNTFATCHEHRTGNFTDNPAYIGPTLWTSDPEIYNGGSGSDVWSEMANGSHLDMLHATEYCMGIAYESGSAYWTFNGALGTIDRYDFGVPHIPGHEDHNDGAVTRYFFADALTRLPDVPSNLEVSGEMLFIADTGNGRVVGLDRAAGTVSGSFRIPEEFFADSIEDAPLTEIIGRDALVAEWGEPAQPSGLAMLNDDTLIIASHASGHLSIVTTEGEVLRTIDTGTGEGLGGVTVHEGVIYFTQMRERRVYRVDVDESMRVTP